MADNLFEPVTFGGIGECKNRIVMAPLTRLRADPATGILPDYTCDYYRQRAEAGMIIVEATNISQVACGYAGAPGIWNEEQVGQWKKITSAIHAAGGKAVCQLWHTGAVGHESLHPGTPVQGPSSATFPTRCNIVKDGEIVRSPSTPAQEMTKAEIESTVQDYARATRNAQKAGFDGVEIHAAHGYLLCEFMCGSANKREDEYSCQNFENRVRFLMQVLDACKAAAWESDPKCHVGVRISPIGTFNTFQCGPDPYGFAKYLFAELNKKGLAYVHLSEPEWANNILDARDGSGGHTLSDELFAEFRELLKDTPFIGSGGYDREKAIKRIGTKMVDAVAFGRSFITNPDLVDRLKNNYPIAPFEPAHSYKGGPKGYVDWPRYGESSPASTTA